jgi:amino acid transporter
VAWVKRFLVGRPLSSALQDEQRLTKKIALAVFSSDALSSTAYATEEVLFVIVATSSASLALALDTLVPIAIAVAFLLAIVITSYRQVIFAYPGGGGAYVVSRENLGENASLVAAASLMVDYILTVAVSISAGVAAIISIPEFQDLAEDRVTLGLVLIAAITILNLRGVKESGRIFAVPTYVYIVILAAMVGYGLYESYAGEIGKVPFDREAYEGTLRTGGSLGIFLRASRPAPSH